jgi:hypothetical protein
MPKSQKSNKNINIGRLYGSSEYRDQQTQFEIRSDVIIKCQTIFKGFPFSNNPHSYQNGHEQEHDDATIIVSYSRKKEKFVSGKSRSTISTGW